MPNATIRPTRRPSLPRSGDPVESRGRLRGIDLLRAAAIIQVIAVHLNNLYVPAQSALAARIVAHWSDGVTLFFVLSGFLITRTIMLRESDIHRLSLRGFYARRIARIQPLLLGAIALGAAMLGLGYAGEPFASPGHPAFDASFWFSLVTFSFNWHRFAALQHGLLGWGLHWDVMWSLAIEEQFYLLLPILLIVSVNRRRLEGVLLAVVGLCAGSRLVGPLYLAGWDFSSFAGFDALGIGVATALAAPRFDPGRGTWFLAAGLALIALAASGPDYSLRPVALALGAAVATLGAQARDEIFGAVWRLPARLGALSFEMYLLHPLLLAALAPLLRAGFLSFGAALALAVAAIAAVAHLVERCFTAPANRRLRQVLLASVRLSAGRT